MPWTIKCFRHEVTFFPVSVKYFYFITGGLLDREICFLFSLILACASAFQEAKIANEIGMYNVQKIKKNNEFNWKLRSYPCHKSVKDLSMVIKKDGSVETKSFISLIFNSNIYLLIETAV